MKNEKPILFSTPMVKAVLDGNKTQTRRITGKTLKMINENPDHWMIGGRSKTGGILFVERSGENPKVEEVRLPYGEIGSELWVRETFAKITDNHFIYRANPEHQSMIWKPSIFMPRIASRIQLKITDIRVERIQDITWQDALAEGVWTASAWLRGETCVWRDCPSALQRMRIEAFQTLWNSINGKPKKDGTIVNWESNPWVWAVSFEVLE